jgi:hypothetical protein
MAVPYSLKERLKLLGMKAEEARKSFSSLWKIT